MRLLASSSALFLFIKRLEIVLCFPFVLRVVLIKSESDCSSFVLTWRLFRTFLGCFAVIVGKCVVRMQMHSSSPASNRSVPNIVHISFSRILPIFAASWTFIVFWAHNAFTKLYSSSFSIETLCVLDLGLSLSLRFRHPRTSVCTRRGRGGAASTDAYINILQLPISSISSILILYRWWYF